MIAESEAGFGRVVISQSESPGYAVDLVLKSPAGFVGLALTPDKARDIALDLLRYAGLMSGAQMVSETQRTILH